MDRRDFIKMTLTTPIELMASRQDQDEGLVQVRELERRIQELEDRLYSQGLANKSTRSFLNGDFYLQANGLNIINQNGVAVGTWQNDGDIFFGTNVSNPPSGVTIAIFNAAQTYNGESMEVGDMLFGDNSVSKASMLWDASAGILYFRGGNPRSNKVYINTTGELYAGGGVVRLNEDGLEVRNNSDTKYIAVYNSTITVYTGAVGYINVDQYDPLGNTYGTAVFGMQHDANNQSNIYCYFNGVNIAIQAGGNWQYTIEAMYNHVIINAATLNFSSIPTSSSGLESGDVWRNGNNLMIV